MTEFKTEINDEWFAGFFDGEGCAKLTKQRKNGKIYGHFSIILSQSGEDGLRLLKKIQRIYGGSIYKHLAKGQYKATKPAYKLYWGKKEGKDLLIRIKNKLFIKRKDAEIVLKYINRHQK